MAIEGIWRFLMLLFAPYCRLELVFILEH